MKKKTNVSATRTEAKSKSLISESESKVTEKQVDSQMFSEEMKMLFVLEKYKTIMGAAMLSLMRDGHKFSIRVNYMDFVSISLRIKEMIKNARENGFLSNGESEDVNLARRAWRWNS